MGLSNKPSEYKAKLGIKLKIITEKRYIISSHLEQVMVLYDVSKTKNLIAETPVDKAIANHIFELSKRIVKELAQNFQLVDHELKNIVEDILECNMPFKPNPLQSWYHTENPHKDLDINEFTGEKLSRTPRMSISLPRKLRTSISADPRTAQILANALNQAQNRKVSFNLSVAGRKPKEKVINEGLIHRAIIETD